MSGPKVVKVITREELVASGEALLRRLNAALADWERCATATGATVADQNACQERRDSLERMLRADKFEDFTRAALAEVSFLEVDAERRTERAAQARAQEKVRRESGRELARVLLRQDGASQDRAALIRAAAGELELKELDAVLARARQSLFQFGSPESTKTQKQLAARLAAGQKADDIESWRERSVAASAQVSALMAHIANLELLGAADTAAKLQQDVLTACALEDVSNRAMRLDSLQVELRNAKHEALTMAKLRRHASLLAAEAAQTPEGADIVKSLTAAVYAAPGELQAAIDLAQARIDADRVADAAQSRRRAVLDGLQQLGYQVHEQLSTATATGGRLVVRASTESNYGVEVIASGSGERMQVRTVALTSNRDQSGDVPAEQRWCDDFGKLKKQLASHGAKLIVENALGVGAVPVKVLNDAQKEERGRATAATTTTRRK